MSIQRGLNFSKKTYRKAWIFFIIILLILTGFKLITFMKMMNYFPSDRSRILLSIMADEESMATLVNASQHTWIPLWPYDIVYFISDNQTYKLFSFFSTQWNVVRLQATNAKYGNVHFTYSVWSYLYNHYAMNYDYFLLIDSATYVNVKNILTMVKSLKCTNCYIGRPVRNDELSTDQPIFSCNSMGYVIARNTLLKFGPNIEQCRPWISSYQTGKEMGGCVHRYASGLSCTRANPFFERVINTGKPEQTKDKGAKSQADFPEGPPTYLFKASLIYPLKEAKYFSQFHRQVVQELRPVLNSVVRNDSCVVNPLVQNEIHPSEDQLPECRLSESHITIDTEDRKRFGAFVLTLPDTISRARQVIQLFKEHKVQPEIFIGTSGVKVPEGVKLSPGEWNLRLGMTRLLQKVNASDYEHVLVLEDDAVPHRQFAKLFPKVIADQRCGEAASHGILLLGATIWDAAWKKLDTNNVTEQGLCKNICYEAFGSFAVLLHRATFEPILALLNDDSDPQPYDLMFRQLAILGYPSRIAVPHLAITDVRHISLIRPQKKTSELYNLHARARTHRWKLKDYMISKNNAKQLVSKLLKEPKVD